MIETCCLILLTAAAKPSRVAEEPPPPPPPMEVAQPAPPPAEPLPGVRAFGVRAGFGGSTATPGIDVGNVGVKLMVTDGMALSLDLGLGLTAYSGYSQASFAADAVLGIYLRGRGASLRPYVPLLFGLGFASRATQQPQPQPGANPDPYATYGQPGSFSVAAGAGIGAEYWFSASFSVAADLLLRLGLTNLDPLVVSIGTLTPGIHATYWF